MCENVQYECENCQFKKKNYNMMALYLQTPKTSSAKRIKMEMGGEDEDSLEHDHTSAPIKHVASEIRPPSTFHQIRFLGEQEITKLVISYWYYFHKKNYTILII